jgi:hypothetical protein
MENHLGVLICYCCHVDSFIFLHLCHACEYCWGRSNHQSFAQYCHYWGEVTLQNMHSTIRTNSSWSSLPGMYKSVLDAMGHVDSYIYYSCECIWGHPEFMALQLKNDHSWWISGSMTKLPRVLYKQWHPDEQPRKWLEGDKQIKSTSHFWLIYSQMRHKFLAICEAAAGGPGHLLEL